MFADYSYPWAVVAGALSFLSPCVLPLVPPYLCYMAGVSAEELRDDRVSRTILSTRLRVVVAALAFVLGFSTVFVTSGVGASSVGHLVRVNGWWLSTVAGLVIIVMGLHFLGVFRIALLSGELRLRAPDRPNNLFGAYLMGLAFAFGWTPCIGPVLGAIFGLAGAKDTVGEGAALLGAYSAGLGVPFLLAAAFSGAFLRWSAQFRRHLGKVEKAMGGLLVGTGVLFLTGGMQRMSFWLLETFPALQQIG